MKSTAPNSSVFEKPPESQEKVTEGHPAPENANNTKSPEKENPIPQTMSQIVFDKPNEPTIKEVPVPELKFGEALIKVEVAPINHIDLYMLSGKLDIGINKLGCEGSGTVVKASGLFGWRYEGKRVTFILDDFGALGQYVAVPQTHCFVLDDDVSFEDGGSIGNAMTAIAALDTLKEGDHKAVVLNAPAGDLGRKILRYFKEENLKTIAIIRKAEHQRICEDNGAVIVLNQNEKNFDEDLKKYSKEFKATAFFDWVGGSETARVLKSMPKNSVCYLGGNLSMANNADFLALDVLVHGKSIKNFSVSNYLSNKNFISKFFAVLSAKKHSKDTFKTQHNSKSFKLSEVKEAIEYYKKDMTAGKVFIRPNSLPSSEA